MRKIQIYERKLLSSVISENDPNVNDKRSEVLAELIKIKPKKLFRYRSCNEITFDALLKDRIYFNTAANFNDPYDCTLYVNNEQIKQEFDHFTKETLTSQMNIMRNVNQQIQIPELPNQSVGLEQFAQVMRQMNEEQFKVALDVVSNLDNRFWDNIKQFMYNLTDEIQDVFHEINTRKTYIACFSEEINSMLMWSHYSDYHKGFAIEYDLRNLEVKCTYCEKQCDKKHFLTLYPMLYKKERFDATRMVTERLLHTAKSRLFNEQLPFIIPDIFFEIKTNTIKSIEWKYEKEWRLFYNCRNPNPAGNYEKIVPKAIYLGCKISDINKRIILNLVKEKNIPIYQMELKMDNNKYKLNYKKTKHNKSNN